MQPANYFWYAFAAVTVVTSAIQRMHAAPPNEAVDPGAFELERVENPTGADQAAAAGGDLEVYDVFPCGTGDGRIDLDDLLGMVRAFGGIYGCSCPGGGGWRLPGNAATDPNADFIGTTDNVALNFRVNNQRVMRFEPEVDSPNIIGGHVENSAGASAYGAVIAGGGFSGLPNQVNAEFGTVGGGFDNVAGESGTVAGGQNNTAGGSTAAIGGGFANTASGNGSTVGGGHQNTASGRDSTIGGGLNNTGNGFFSTIGGGEFNMASGQHATVAGGQSNTAFGFYSVVAGGLDNTAIGNDSTVGGGFGNAADGDLSAVVGGEGNTASGSRAAVGGGRNNMASGLESTVNGGRDNTAGFEGATVGGGLGNTAGGSFSTVAGGVGNTASGFASTVPGGQSNTASGFYSFAAGNGASALHEGTFVWADRSTPNENFSSLWNNQFLIRATGGVGIGTNAPNSQLHVNGNGVDPSLRVQVDGASRLIVAPNGGVTVGTNNSNPPERGLYVFGNVGVGTSNPGSHDLAVVGNGTGVSGATLNVDNTSTGSGIAANIRSDGTDSTVVIGNDGTGDMIRAFSSSQPCCPLFQVTHSGRVGMGRDSAPGFPLHVGTNSTNGNGAHVTNGGTWVNGSSRTSKRNFEDIDKREVLRKVVDLPVTSWQYKGEDDSVRHVGPVAEDFRAALGLGHDERYITTIDADGVALAAIQGLHQIIEEKECEIDDLREQGERERIRKDREITELRERLAKLEAMMATLAGQSAGGAR